MKKSLFISFILFLGVILIFPLYIHAQTASELRAQIENTNSEIAKLDKEIKRLNEQITKTSTEKNTLTRAIKDLTLKRDKLLKEKTQTEKKIKATGLVITTLNDKISVQNNILNKSKESLSSLIYKLYQQDNDLLINKILAQNNLSDLSREYNNIISLNRDIKEYILDVNEKKESLTQTKNIKEDEKDALDKLKKTLTVKQIEIEKNKKEKDSLLTQTKNQESNYKKLLEERIKQRDAFEKSLADYENQLKFILNPKLLPKEGARVFSWPLEKVFITQLFGYTSSSKRLYRSGTHSGVDFRAPIGTPVMAMASGVVVGTGDTDEYCKGASFGKWVFIKYNNGLSSTYGHLSSINATAGEKVKAGDIVALSGNTGHSTGPHLHVTVYASDGAEVKKVPSLSCNGKSFIMPIAASSAYLDPMLYLPKITSDMVKK